MLTPTITTTTSTSTSTSTLTFDKHQNTNLTRVPANYRIQKRPIPHAAVASPYAGTHVPKIVYVGSKTPFMSAIKRVQKLLHLAERRAMAPLVDEKAKKRRQHHQQSQQNKRGEVETGTEKAVMEECLRKLRQEKVLIKATGRAIEKALALGSWFQEKAQEYEVGIRTGSVCVVDDIVRVEEDGVNVFTMVDTSTNKENDGSDSDEAGDDDDAMDTTMGNSDNSMDHTGADTMIVDDAMDIDAQPNHPPAESKNQRRRRRRRDRERQHRLQASLDSDGEPPESRTRWVSMIEVAVSLK